MTTLNDGEDFYEKAVRNLIESDSNQVISNGKTDHAAILYQYFFEYARKDVSIFCHNLSNDVFGNPRVVEAARNALKKDVRVRIITQADPEEGPFLEFVKSNNVIQFKKASADHIAINFAVVDSKRYRFERDHGKCEAVACMSNPPLAGALMELFDRIDKGHATA